MVNAEPTIKPFGGFNAAEDAQALRSAMKGLGTDEETILNILTTRSNTQRQAIRKIFNEEFGRDLIGDLKSELGGKFEDVIVALIDPPHEYLCKELNHAMEGAGTSDATLIEILCSQDNQNIQQIVVAYEQLFGRPLAEHVCSETSSDFRRLLTLIVTAKDDRPPNRERANQAAQELLSAGEGRLGTDEEVFNRILAHESFPQLRLIFEEYKNIAGRTIEQAIHNEIDGDLREALLAIVECVEDPPTYFAKRLHEAMAGAGTSDRTLIRIIVSRSEIDLGSIKKEYEHLYDKTLANALESETGGDFKRALLAILGGP